MLPSLNIREPVMVPFNELDDRGQEAALARYGRDSVMMISLSSSLDTLALIKRMQNESWRFSEHGERTVGINNANTV